MASTHVKILEVFPFHEPALGVPAPAGSRRLKAGHQTRARLVLLLVLFDLFAAVTPARAFDEYQVKATYLYHFAQFVEWPPDAFPTESAPFVIGVLGDDPFGKTLDELVKDEVVNKRKLVVQRYRRVEDIVDCHILFVSRSEAARLDRILSVLRPRSILTVSDVEEFARRGGIIRLLTEQNRVRLRINIDAAKAARLTISSKVLRAAERIGEGGADK